VAEPVILEFPFDSGAYEAADSRWTPEGVLAVAENVRLDLDGRLGVRPGYTALGITSYVSGTNMTAYDVTNFAGRLVVLGDQTGVSRPTDLFELINGVRVWRGTAGEDAGVTGERLPRATNLRQIGRVPDQSKQILAADVAAIPGFVAVAASMSDKSVIHIFDPSDNQTVILTTRNITRAKVIAVGSTFWIIGQKVTSPNQDDIVGYPFTPGTDIVLPTSETVLRALAVTVSDLAVATVGSGFVIAYGASGDVFAERFNSAGVTQANWTASTDPALSVAVSGNTAGTLISVAWQVSGGTKNYLFSTFNAAGTLQNGPTTLFAGSLVQAPFDARRLGMRQEGAVICFIGVADSDFIFGSIFGEFETVTQECTNQATHAMGVTNTYRNSVPQTLPIHMANGSNREWYYGVVDYLAAARSKGTNHFVERSTRFQQCFVDPQLGPRMEQFGSNAINGTATIGTKVYWASILRTSDTGNETQDTQTFVVNEMEMTDTGRRAVTVLANELHIAGALPMVYDGQGMWEQGFNERPVINDISQAAGGSKTLLGVYFVRAVWEVIDARGNILRSAASDPVQRTLTGANQTINGSASVPHSLRTNGIFQNTANYAVRLAIYCTTAGGSNFFLDQTVLLDQTADTYAPRTFSLTQSDLQLRDNLVLYEQSQTPLSHTAPPPHRYKWAARARELIGATTQEEGWGFSKLLFPAEVVEYANQGRLGFNGRANQAVTGVAAFEQAGIIFTASEIQQIFGRGPEHSGTGEFDDPMNVASPGGCSNWLSIVAAPPGIFFQMDDEKLMLLGRKPDGSAGDVQWVGQPIRQTLKLFPLITGAVHVRSQMLVAFSANNVAGNDGRIFIFDLRRGQWFIDNVGAKVDAISEFAGRLCYVSGGVVFMQDVAPGSGAMPTQRYGSGFIRITRALGWGHIYKLGLLGTVLDECTVECFIDYDDGVGPQSLGSIAFVGTEGAREEFWSLSQQKTSRFSVTFVVTCANPNTLGFRANGWAAKVEGSKSTTRVGSTGAVA
jgi:hypothetical protein